MAMPKPALSVIMPAYNAEETVAAAIDSIISQTWRDFELIIVDDCSSDGTEKAVRVCRDARIVLLRNERNAGVARTLAKAVAAAKGTLLARADADDLNHPTRFEKQVRYLREHPDVGVVGAAYELIDERSHVFDSRVRPGDDEYLQRELLKLNPICHGSVMMRREIVLALGGYDDRFLHAEDYDLWLRCAEVTRLALMGEKLYLWRVTPRSVTQSARGIQERSAARARKMAWERRLNGRDKYGRVLNVRPRRTAEKLLLAEHCVVWGREALRARRVDRAARLFTRAALLDPASRRLKEALMRAPAAITRAVARVLSGRNTAGGGEGR
jgi:glycosyltransferase involved in cell wall biosynthesis